MKIVVLDITGRTSGQYDQSLCENLAEVSSGNIVSLLTTRRNGEVLGYQFVKLFTLVPSDMTSSESMVKRFLRALELILNYIYVAFYIGIKKPDILHIQWLPLLEFSSGERTIIKLFKLLDKRLKVVLTVHNIYPHNSTQANRVKYKQRFIALHNVIDRYIVHLNSAKDELSKEFGVNPDRVSIAYHGLFKANGYSTRDNNPLYTNDLNIIMYGYQSEYKGTDILIDALDQLPPDYLQKTHTTIVGRTEPSFYEKYIKKCDALNIEWINDYVSDSDLYSKIEESGIIVLPYREISQSGVLLLALSFKKPILTSDLPSFKETLDGYNSEWFFETNNYMSLKNLLMEFIDKKIDISKMTSIIDSLNIKYSWAEAAKATLNAYKKALINE